MPDPFPGPATGSLPKLYRMLRDNAYYVAGTILCLTPDQVNPLHHEEVNVDAHDSEERRTMLVTMQDVVQHLNRCIVDLEARVATLEAPPAPVTELVDTPGPPAPPPEPPADILTEPVSQDPHIEA